MQEFFYSVVPYVELNVTTYVCAASTSLIFNYRMYYGRSEFKKFD